MNKKFEYAINAIHYCIYLEEVWTNSIIQKCMNRIWRVILLKRHRDKKCPSDAKSQMIESFPCGKHCGMSVGLAHHLFGYLYSAYSSLLSFILLGGYLRFFGNVNTWLIILIIAIPIGICYIPAYKAVFANDKYLKYFKQFEKENELWHRKWKRITIVFCTGAVVAFLLGIGTIWGVLFL